MDAASLDVSLKDIPFRSPFEYKPQAVRTKVRARYESTYSAASGSDPTATRFGWCDPWDVSDPRQWFVAGTALGRPETWTHWADIYQYFVVTDVKVTTITHFKPNNIMVNQDTVGRMTVYGGKVVHDLSHTLTAATYRSEAGNSPSTFWMREKQRPSIERAKFFDVYPGTAQHYAVDGSAGTALGFWEKPNKYVQKSKWDLLKWYQARPMDLVAAVAEPYSMWTQTDVSVLTGKPTIFPVFWYSYMDHEIGSGEQPPVAYTEIYLEWDIVFSFPIYNDAPPP